MVAPPLIPPLSAYEGGRGKLISTSPRSSRSTEPVLGQSGLHNETKFHYLKKKKNPAGGTKEAPFLERGSPAHHMAMLFSLRKRLPSLHIVEPSLSLLALLLLLGFVLSFETGPRDSHSGLMAYLHSQVLGFQVRAPDLTS